MKTALVMTLLAFFFGLLAVQTAAVRASGEAEVEASGGSTDALAALVADTTEAEDQQQLASSIDADAGTDADADADTDVSADLDDSAMAAELEKELQAAEDQADASDDEGEGEDEAEEVSLLSASEHADESESEGEELDLEALRRSRAVAVAGAKYIHSAVLEFEEVSDDAEAQAADDREDAEATAEEQQAEQAEQLRFAASGEGAGKPPKVEYDEPLAKEVITYAQAAYYPRNPQRCVRKSGHSDFTVQHSVATTMADGSKLYGYTAVDNAKRRVVAAFHGDVTLSELARKLYKGKPMKIKRLCKSCKTHRFYAEAVALVCPEMVASMRVIMREQEHADYTVILTGHGFGAALAALCSYEMEMARVFTPAMHRIFISYGQPRAGNSHWARKFNQMFPSSIRIVHGDDPVAHIPPCHADRVSQTCIEKKDRKLKLWAFHNPTQVWYPSKMPNVADTASASDDKPYQICRSAPWGEDSTCRHRPLGFSLDDHAEYFGVEVANSCRRLLGKTKRRPKRD